MSSTRWAVYSAVTGCIAAGLLAIGAVGFYRQLPGHEPARVQPAPPPAAATVAPPPVARTSAAGPASSPEAGYYAQLRSRLRWVQTRVGRELLLTPDLKSRMLLAKSAAERASLSDVGLDFRDVYGLINAETSWVPRRGSSRNGTPNLGIAQFEPATAKALGLTDPDDPVEAIHAAALHMKEAAEWSRDRIRSLKLGKAERAQKLREGVSVYYNLSWRARSAWNGSNTDDLPVQTQRHIVNTRQGAEEALMLDAQLRAQDYERRGAILTASGQDSRI